MAAHRFQAGDHVVVRSFEDMSAEYPVYVGPDDYETCIELPSDVGFVEEMREICGEEFEIEDIIDRESYQIVIPTVLCPWTLTNEMLILLSDDRLDDVVIDEGDFSDVLFMT